MYEITSMMGADKMVHVNILNIPNFKNVKRKNVAIHVVLKH